MKYRITHTTFYNYSQAVGLCQNEARLQPRYNYSQAVGLCQNEARLQPRDFWRQQCQSSRFEITPTPTDFRERNDYFGNRVAYFAIQQPHKQLSVTAISEVVLFPKQNTMDLGNQLSWEQVRNLLQESPTQSQFQTPTQFQNQNQNLELLDARQYIFDSPMVTTSPELAEYAKSSFLPNRPLVEVVRDLMQRIHTDFVYDPTFTTIATPLSDVLAHRRGVCQDFAHLAIASLRAYGIASRYISGYIETVTQPGKLRLVGADASHAWFSVYLPGTGWLEFDPTNNKLPHDQHITLAWGRDYFDVTPLKGIAFGGGHHRLSVSVDVLRLE